jgi:hypothetical protein
MQVYVGDRTISWTINIGEGAVASLIWRRSRWELFRPVVSGSVFRWDHIDSRSGPGRAPSRPPKEVEEWAAKVIERLL